MLRGLGEHELSEMTFGEVEKFVCILYTGNDNMEHVNEVRHHLFVKGRKSLESLSLLLRMPLNIMLKEQIIKAVSGGKNFNPNKCSPIQ